MSIDTPGMVVVVVVTVWLGERVSGGEERGDVGGERGGVGGRGGGECLTFTALAQ